MIGFLYNNSRVKAHSSSAAGAYPQPAASPHFGPGQRPATKSALPPAKLSLSAANPEYESGLAKKLSFFLQGRPAVIACVGTDLVGGDCLGPLVGQLLVEADAPAYIYGTLKCPITALNIEETREFIRINHSDRLVIAVDCAVGAKNEEGLIAVSGTPLRPGLALGKQLGDLGDISVTAVTSCHTPDKKEFSLVRLGFVYRLARRVARLILSCLYDTLYIMDKDYAIENCGLKH